MDDQSYHVNEPQIVHEMIDGEVVIVDLDEGTYYSSQGIGAQIWAMVDQGYSGDAITAEFEQRYGMPRETVSRDVAYMLRTLLSEELIKPNSEGTLPADGRPDLKAAPEAYEMPEITKYVDMQNLLVLDPIHEVDEDVGWPHAKH